MKKPILLIAIAVTMLMGCDNPMPQKHLNTKIVDSLISETSKESELATQYNDISQSIMHDAKKLVNDNPGDRSMNATAIGLLTISQTFNKLAKQHNDIAIQCNSKAELLNDQDLKTLRSN